MEAQYGVLVKDPDEDLWNWAYAAAHRGNYATTIHWDEKTCDGVVFWFCVHLAAIAFMAHCAKAGIPFKGL
jgi:hypothetical protein